ncbi:MAG: hypothetical protein OEZ25_02595 [Candidatus Bathyarchaeota archaeon]|nr:hypothetical protein [Candidatus Bathyarchaeota archaeon]
MKDWLYYRIYAEPHQKWYHDLLEEVVKPFISENEKMIESFFFFHYHHPYGVKPWDEIEAHEPKFKQGEEVWFIRLRVLAEKSNLKTLEESLNKFIGTSKTAFEHEKCTYNEKGDLGGRFGEVRREFVRKYLEYASKIALSLLDEPRDQKYFEKVMGLMHLPANMFEFNILISCEDKVLFQF